MENRSITAVVGDYVCNNKSIRAFADELFYDWFCKDESLPRRAQALLDKLVQIAGSEKFSRNDCYVFFKNCCPLANVPTYDQFSICKRDGSGALYCVVPKSSHNNKAEVWGKENDFAEPLVQGNWSDVKDFFAGTYYAKKVLEAA